MKKAVVSLHPRRFGKSLFVSMLNEYYDLKNKDRLTTIFEGCWIAQNLTPNAASFLVLPLDFSNLETQDFVRFEQDFNAKNNGKLNTFLNKYHDELKMPLVENSNFVMNFRSVSQMAMQKGFKVGMIFVFLCQLSF